MKRDEIIESALDALNEVNPQKQQDEEVILNWVYNETRKEALSIANVSRSFPCKTLNDVKQNAAAILATITHPENMTTEEMKEIEEIALEILEYCRENCG